MEMKSVTEDTPLITITSHQTTRTRPSLHRSRSRSRYFAFWRATSATHRFFLLLLFSLIPFGGHFVKNGMSSLEPLMVHDPSFPLSNTMYGALVSAVSVPNMFIPLMGGRLLDRSGHRSIRFFLLWICIGQIIFAIGMDCQWFWLALFGRVFFGVGEGSVVVGARVFVAYWFRSKELTFAMGVMVAVTNLSKMLAKSTVAPIALYFGGYVHALWYGVLVCLLSVVVGIITCKFTSRLKRLVKDHVQQNEPLQPELEWLEDYADTKRKEYQQHLLLQQLSSHPQPMRCESVYQFTSLFWTIAILHVVFVTVFHLFQNVSSSFLYERYGYSVIKSGIVSAVSHSFVVFAPFIGLLIDHFGGRMYWIVGASILSIIAYALMIFTEINPLVSMMMISICLSFTPTILMAAIPNSVNRQSFGAAFGIVEITDAVGATFGNLMIGFLRDATGSYDVDMYVLLGMAILTFVGSIVLVVQDKQTGWVLSAPKRRTRSLSIGDDAHLIGLAQLTEDEDGSGSGSMSPGVCGSKSPTISPSQGIDRPNDSSLIV